MWAWIGSNAITLLTAALVVLTAVLAWVGLAQVKFQGEATRALRRQLLADIRLLSTIVFSLPGPTKSPHEMIAALTRDAVIRWGDFNFDRFRTTAADLSDEAANTALIIEWSMKRLQMLLDPVQAARSPEEYDWNKFDWLVWNNSIAQARESLLKIGKELGSTPLTRAEISKLLFRA
jgi:hypothetical protein